MSPARANPYFVVDAPGGGGKIPLIPNYVESFNEDQVVLTNFWGDRYGCKQPNDGRKPVRTTDPEYLSEPSFERPAARKNAARRKTA